MTMRETLEAQQLLWAQKIPKGFDNFFPKGGSTGDSTAKGGEVRGGGSVGRSTCTPGAAAQGREIAGTGPRLFSVRGVSAAVPFCVSVWLGFRSGGGGYRPLAPRPWSTCSRL